MALTTTISTFLESPEILTAESFEKAPASSLSTKSTIHTIVTVRTSKASSDTSTTTSSEIKTPSSQVASPESTEKPQSEAEKPDSDAADADSTSAAKLETAERSQTSEVEEASPALVSGSKQNDTDHSATSDYQGLKSNSGYPVEPATITKSQSTVSPTVGLIEGLVSAIQSVVAQQEGASQTESSSKDSQHVTEVEPAVISTAASAEQPAESVTGFAIGTQTVGPGGDAVTRGGSVYSALPSGSGLRVVADGQTSTITAAVLPVVAVAQGSGSANDYVVGDNTLTAGGPAITSDGNIMSALPAGSGVRIAANGQTTTVPAAALPDSVTLRTGDSEDEYIFAGNTLSAGDTALDFAGVTYSALKSGSGIIIIAEDSTSTASIGQAIGSDVATEGDLDTPSPLVLPAGSQQLVTTTSVSPNTTISVQETESSSSTRGLGDAIISGMGGGNADDEDGDANTPDSQSSTTTDVEAASHAVRRSMHVLLGGFCTFASALALL
ncbi:hypothetical protein Q7P36_003297 [Cladosporium allicinum]